MDKANLIKIIEQGESISVEFKQSRNKLNKNVFESVCAFLNRHGGHLFLGVDDNGTIVGIKEDATADIINNFVTQCNNPLKLDPPYYLSPEIITIKDKQIIYVYVPESSQVHKTIEKVFDRNDDGDFNVSKNSSHLSQLYLRKQNTYTENNIYPYANLDDLDSGLINRVRIRAKNENNGKHPWFEMNNMELLKSAQLYKKDFKTGEKGVTLAGILLFGKDKTILSVLPHHKTDAILRQKNLNRYDDRDDIRTNLIDSYDRLMSFVEKHLPDPFYLEKDIRISLRSKIFREAVGNILIHREFSNAFPAKMIIEQNRVLFENANRPHGSGHILPDVFTPFPKNPNIARVFKEIGFADELGSGVRNLFKYTAEYSNGGSPELIENDIFKIIIPITKQITGEVTAQATGEVTAQATGEVTAQATGEVTAQATGEVELQAVIITYCMQPRSTEEMMRYMRLKHKEHFRLSILKPLLKKELLLMTIPDKPNSPKQKYYTNKKLNKETTGEVTAQATGEATGEVTAQATGEATGEVTAQATGEVEHQAVIITYCMQPRNTEEMMRYLKLKHKEHFRLNILSPLLKKELLLMTIPDKPNSPKQKYYTNKKMM